MIVEIAQADGGSQAARSVAATGRTAPSEASATPQQREPDAGDELVADLLALVRCGLIEIRRDACGEWRTAIDR